MNKNDRRKVYTTLGASNHIDEDREEFDYYATDPEAVKMLLELEKFSPTIIEPCCGEGHISKVLASKGYKVISTDLIDRGFGKGGIDFHNYTNNNGFDVITNPPYVLAGDFLEHFTGIMTKGSKLVMFLKLLFLEGIDRGRIFSTNPPKTVYISSRRIACAKNGEFKNDRGEDVQSAVAYAWFVWEIGFRGDPVIKWFNNK